MGPQAGETAKFLSGDSRWGGAGAGSGYNGFVATDGEHGGGGGAGISMSFGNSQAGDGGNGIIVVYEYKN